MAAEPQLTPACELAFAVAREGVDQAPALEAPAAMRSFLHVPQLPRRALTVAQRVIDEDPEFRNRVAERASEDIVGRAGWLWLTRPEGWEVEVGALTGRMLANPHAARPGEGEAHQAGPVAFVPSEGERLLFTDIERELDGLRSLVTRLASEQQSVPSALQQLEAEVEQREAQLSELSEQLERSARGLEAASAAHEAVEVELREVRDERDAVAAALEAALTERDEARARTGELTGQLEELRADLHDVTAQRIGFQAELEQVTDQHHRTLASQQEQLDELGAQLALAQGERDELARQLEEIDVHGLADDSAGQDAIDASAEIEHGVIPALSSASEAAHLLASAVEEAVHRLEALRLRFAVPGAGDGLAVGGPDAGQPERIAFDAFDATVGEAGGPVSDEADHVGAEPEHGFELVDAEPEHEFELVDAEPEHEFELVDAEHGTTPVPSQDAALAEHAAVDPAPVDELGTIEDEADWELSDLMALYGSSEADRAPAADHADASNAGDAPDLWSTESGDARRDDEWARLVGDPEAPQSVPDNPSEHGTSVEELDWDSLLEPRREAWTNPADSVAARRPAEIPAELRPDPVAVARFLVSVADVIVIVDGDAVGSLGWPTLPVAERRDALVSYLADLAGDTGAAPDVVFDGTFGGELGLPNSDTVRVRLTAPGISAVRAVGELIDTYPVDWPVVVVTDDAALVADATHRGAAVLSNVQLLDLFIAQ